MCGIVGYMALGAGDLGQTRANLEKMNRRLEHRGPDGEGLWISPDRTVGLGHKRLAIIDLSESGAQPMASASGRFQMVYNGEVYNFLSMRRELAQLGASFCGHSDTEVILAGFERWGISETTKKLVGMFAFAVWDQKKRRLYLVRDRLGIKPLYIGLAKNTIVFGSELKALSIHPDWQHQVDLNALRFFVKQGYIPAPHSIYQNAQKVWPGTILALDADLVQGFEKKSPWGAAPRSGSGYSVESYWSAHEAATRGRQDPFSENQIPEALEQLERLLQEAVSQRMIADVPLGAFLSGGIDSSLVVALMQSAGTKPVQTFTIGFHENAFDEATYAAQVAKHLGTDHTELYLSPKDAMDVIPKLAGMYSEPFADSSQIPTYLVSQLARQHVTVSLSGDGGDELFGGYDRYQRIAAIWRQASRIPAPIRGLAAGLAMRMPGLSRRPQVHRKLQILAARTPEAFYGQAIAMWPDVDDVVRSGHELPSAFNQSAIWPRLEQFMEKMMFVDSLTYLPDDILAKVDRASMAVSLESRVPLLDHRVFEHAWRWPIGAKVRAGQQKWPLRQILGKYIPPPLFERPKQGFGVPVSQWVRGPLRAWAEQLLDPKRLGDEGFFQVGTVRARWQDHLDHGSKGFGGLWNILMFQAWLDESKG